jgi:hypothetical protein
MDSLEVADARRVERRDRHAVAADELMRVTKRTSFATPFVVVIGCSGPAVVPPPPPPLRPEPADASVIDAVRCYSGDLICEGPKCGAIGGEGGVIVPVTSVHVGSDGLGIVVKTPPNVRVQEWWRGVFVDDNDQPIAGTEFRIDAAGNGVFATGIAATCDLPSPRVSVWPPADYVPPKPRKPRGPTFNPPRPFDAKIVRVEVQGSETIVTFDAGSDRGVTSRARATVASKIDCAIIRVDAKRAMCRLRATDITATTITIAP